MILTVDEVKAHLRIETDDEDELIERLILQGQAAAEDFCRVKFEPEVVPIGLRSRKLPALSLGPSITQELADPDSGTSSSVPEPVKLAVMLFVSHYYENRDIPDRTLYTTMRIAFENLLYPYRDPDKMF